MFRLALLSVVFFLGTSHVQAATLSDLLGLDSLLTNTDLAPETAELLDSDLEQIIDDAIEEALEAPITTPIGIPRFNCGVGNGGVGFTPIPVSHGGVTIIDVDIDIDINIDIDVTNEQPEASACTCN